MINSLKYYQGLGYGIINSLIRDADFKESLLTTHKNDEIIQHINNIDSQLKYNHYENLYFRGISGSFIPQSIQSSSSIIINTAFTSTTSNEHTAQSFVDGEGCCILVFKIPSSLKTYQYSYSGYSEDEVLIERNTQFKIVSKGKKNYYFAELHKYTPPVKTKPDLSFEKMIEEERKRQMENIDDDWEFTDTDTDE